MTNLSRLDYFAAAAMQGILISLDNPEATEMIATAALEQAKAMISAIDADPTASAPGFPPADQPCVGSTDGEGHIMLASSTYGERFCALCGIKKAN